MTDFDKLLETSRRQVLKALDHLEYSFKKVLKLTTDTKNLSDEDLETWEGLVSRFARVSDLFFVKYVRTRVQKEDPAFRGTFRDTLDQAEKIGIIDSAAQWLSIRELRNKTAHEYVEERLAALFEAIRKETPLLLAIREKLT